MGTQTVIEKEYDIIEGWGGLSYTEFVIGGSDFVRRKAWAGIAGGEFDVDDAGFGV